jgi:hypothetical protein
LNLQTCNVVCKNVDSVEEQIYITCLKSNPFDPVALNIQTCNVVWEYGGSVEEQSYITYLQNPFNPLAPT